ncbi:hypothetical protein HYN59_07655 [Flavobacterium album]|uniref:RDD domain-containing protein n=1 Tax=Flavobacterium album TaxID=2175091 RepID=A0A2S1QX83_9FLAO|nr:RDD family protein [Flavobacterium album]AWH85008.1 hypothetical protein HYN59_07655 [Flavobacterium album]
MPKKIAIGSIFAALMGMYTELSLTSPVWNRPTWYYYVKDLFTSLNLGYIGIENRFDEMNYINLFFYSLLLTGGILYFFSKKETRLVRYVISMILLTKAIRVFFMMIYLPFTFGELLKGFGWAYFLAYLAWYLLWIWLCWKALKYFRDTKQIATVTQQYEDGAEREIIVESSRWQRLFNLIADVVTFIFIFFPVIESLIKMDGVRNFLKPLEGSVGPQLGLYLICIIFQVIYYTLFEGLLQASPGKMLTETRVVTDTAGKPDMSKLLLRTIVRFVPFESLSVLFSRGWHDDWSDTYVVREKREGVNGGWYFFIFPAFLFLGVTGYLGYKSYEKHKFEVAEKERFERNASAIKEALGHLTQNHIIKLEPESYSYSGGSELFLKTEDIGTDGITFSILELPAAYQGNNSDDVENFYYENKDELTTIKFTRKQLEDAVRKEYVSPDEDHIGGYGNDKKTDGAITVNGSPYYINSAELYFMPNIKLESVEDHYRDDYNLKIVLSNKGRAADLVSIKSNKDKIDWEGSFPKHYAVEGEYSTAPELLGKAEDNDDFDLTLTFRDEASKEYVYRLTCDGDYNKAVLKKIK